MRASMKAPLRFSQVPDARDRGIQLLSDLPRWSVGAERVLLSAISNDMIGRPRNRNKYLDKNNPFAIVRTQANHLISYNWSRINAQRSRWVKMEDHPLDQFCGSKFWVSRPQLTATLDRPSPPHTYLILINDSTLRPHCHPCHLTNIIKCAKRNSALRFPALCHPLFRRRSSIYPSK